MTPNLRCPCGSGENRDACCLPLLAGRRPAATAEQLMRSRYSAFALGDAAYLRSSWHPATRPEPEELATSLDPATRWLFLEILEVRDGGPFEDSGTVEFRATARSPQGRSVLHEISTFQRVDRQWYYRDGRHP